MNTPDWRIEPLNAVFGDNYIIFEAHTQFLTTLFRQREEKRFIQS